MQMIGPVAFDGKKSSPDRFLSVMFGPVAQGVTAAEQVIDVPRGGTIVQLYALAGSAVDGSAVNPASVNAQLYIDDEPKTSNQQVPIAALGGGGWFGIEPSAVLWPVRERSKIRASVQNNMPAGGPAVNVVLVFGIRYE